MAAVNINGTTINTAMGLPTTRDNDIPKVSHKMRCKLRLMYSELEAVIIMTCLYYLTSGYIRFIAGFVKNLLLV